MQERIEQALRRDAIDQALALAREWADSAPDEAAAQRALAVVLARAGDPEAARVALDQAILLSPEDAGLHFERAILLLRSRQLADAGATLDQGLGLDPNHLPSYLARAQIALASDDLAEAERLSRTAARLVDGDHPGLQALDAVLALRRGDADRALALASAASTAMPDDPQLLSILGFGYYAKQHWAFAEQAFRRVSALLPDARALQPMLAQLAARQGQFDVAADLAAALVEDEASATPALRRIAGLYALQAGRDAQALSLLRQALASGPDRAVLEGLITLWRRSGDREDARATLEAALATHRQAGDLWAARLALEAPGSADSDQLLDRWLMAMPDHPQPLAAALRVRDRMGDLEGTARFARRLAEVQPGHPLAEQFLVESLLAQDPDAALARARATAAAQPPGPEQVALRAWLGRLADRAGRPAEAVAEWLALHRQASADRLPLPAHTTAAAAPLPPLAPVLEQARPLLVYGLPGSGIERVIDTLAAAGAPVLADRYSDRAPDDLLRAPAAAQALRDGRLDPAAAIGQWRDWLPARGISDGNAIDWLTWWDNALLLALRPYLPEGLLLAAVRDPRDMLLDWLASGSLVPLALDDAQAAATWLAQGLAQLAELHEQDLYPHILLRLDAVIDSPQALAEAVATPLGVRLPPPPPGPARLPAGRWRAYADVLAGPFAALAPVAVRLGYPDA
ncbi:MAG: tetratricopeptide repeat protein [Pseudoxanthomonas sp.]|nr:tetratricopeptide repeat protein [Pseudoxanthomonas sp.]